MFLVTNLALVMGAKRIVYVGCEQRNGMHFYNDDDLVLSDMIVDFCSVIHEHKHLLGRDHPYEKPLQIMRGLTASVESLRSKPFHAIDHSSLLASWISRLTQEFGLEVFCCSKDSAFIDAGANYLDLEAALSLR
jgi:hypothetical protein